MNLVYLSKSFGLNEVAKYWKQVIEINDYQRNRFANKIVNNLHKNVNKKVITFFGWAFKKDTNDTRESSSIYVALKLLNEGAIINVYDPKVKKERVKDDIALICEFKNQDKRNTEIFLNNIHSFDDPYLASKNSHAVAILTEWDEFKKIDYNKIYESMHKPCFLFDGRKILKSKKLKEIGFKTYEIGK